MISIRDSHSLWSFLTPFSAEVWVLVFAGALATGLVILLMEQEWRRRPSSRLPTPPASHVSDISSGNSKPPNDIEHLEQHCSADGFSATQTGATAMTLSAGAFPAAPSGPGGRIALLGASLVAFVLSGAYTAAYTAQQVHSLLGEPVGSFDELSTKTVGIFKDDAELFESLPLLNIVPFAWDNDEEGKTIVQALLDGKVDALVIDAPFVEYATATTCDLIQVGEVVKPVDLGWVFPVDTPVLYVQQFDVVLQLLDSRGIMDALLDTYFKPSNSCLTKRAPVSTLTLADIGGVWVVLAAVMGFGALWQLLQPPVARLARPLLTMMCGSGARCGGGGSDGAGLGGARNVGAAGAGGSAAGLLAVQRQLAAMQEQLDRMDQVVKQLPFVLDAVVSAKVREERETTVARLADLLHARNGSGSAVASGAGTLPGSAAGLGTGHASGSGAGPLPSRAAASGACHPSGSDALVAKDVVALGTSRASGSDAARAGSVAEPEAT